MYLSVALLFARAAYADDSRPAAPVEPDYSGIALTGQVAAQGNPDKDGGVNGGGGLGVGFTIKKTRISANLNIGNMVSVTGDSSTDFGSAILRLTPDSGVLAGGFTTRIAGLHGDNGGVAINGQLTLAASSWTDERPEIQTATGTDSATVWVTCVDAGVQYTGDIPVLDPGTGQSIDMRLGASVSFTSRFLLDDPLTHYAGAVLSDGGTWNTAGYAFVGGSIRAFFRMNNFEPFVTFNYMAGPEIPTLTGATFILGTKVDGRLLQIKTAKKEDAERLRTLPNSALLR